MNITSLLCLFSLFKGASVGNTQPGISEPMAWPSCLFLQLMPGCHARHMVGGNAVSRLFCATLAWAVHRFWISPLVCGD